MELMTEAECKSINKAAGEIAGTYEKEVVKAINAKIKGEITQARRREHRRIQRRMQQSLCALLTCIICVLPLAHWGQLPVWLAAGMVGVTALIPAYYVGCARALR